MKLRGRTAPKTDGRTDTGVLALRTLFHVVAMPALILAGLSCSDPGARSDGDSRPELALGRSPQYDYDPPVPGSYSLPVLEKAAGGTVLDSAGRELDLAELLRDRITVLSFVYTRCADPKACPMATGVLGTIQSISEEDPVLARSLRLLSFSFDPDHDTPRVMAEYGNRVASDDDLSSEWLFLTTRGVEDLEPILEAYGQRVDRKKNANDPLGPLHHMVRVYLIDRKGMIRNVYSFGLLDPRLLLTDVRTLLMEDTDRAGIR